MPTDGSAEYYGPAVTGQKKIKAITFFFPAYNEEENIIPLIDEARSYLNKVAEEFEILIIVHELSKDMTIPLVREEEKKDGRIRLIIQPKEKSGVGYAIRMGWENARYPMTFYCDSDRQFRLKEFDHFMPLLEKNDIIAGYRINRGEPLSRILTSHAYNLIVRIIFGVRQKDVDCAFRYVHKRVLDKVILTSSLGLVTTEILTKANLHGFRITQVGVHHYPRPAGKPTFEGKLPLPRFSVVSSLIKDILRLRREMNRNISKVPTTNYK